MKFFCLITVGAMLAIAMCEPAPAQVCPNGICPDGTVLIASRTPIRNFAAQFAPVRANGSAGARAAGSSGNRSSVTYTTVAEPVYAVQTYATVKSERTFKVRDWRPLANRRARGSGGR